MSQITTHVLDTSKGLPAEGIAIKLFQQTENQWSEIASGATNSDGRISDLLPADQRLSAGIYRMNFNTADYFSAQNEQGFYPYVDIVFELKADATHYHIPLLLSAFGYSTYRGS